MSEAIIPKRSWNFGNFGLTWTSPLIGLLDLRLQIYVSHFVDLNYFFSSLFAVFFPFTTKSFCIKLQQDRYTPAKIF